MLLAMFARVAGTCGATTPFLNGARFGVCRNLGQIITLLLSLQGWGADLKLTFHGPVTGHSPFLAKAAAKVSGTVCHPPAC